MGLAFSSVRREKGRKGGEMKGKGKRVAMSPRRATIAIEVGWLSEFFGRKETKHRQPPKV